MSATATAEIGVGDQFTSRAARATAHRVVTRSDGKELTITEMEVTVDLQYGNTEESGTTDKTPAIVTGTVHSSNGESREFDIQDLQIGDLPLLVLALQEAIRIGTAQGSFPSDEPITIQSKLSAGEGSSRG